MKQYKATFSIQYWNENTRIVEKIIFAEDMEEVKRNGLKIFINDTLEDDSGVLDDATIVMWHLKEPEEIVSD